MRELKFKSYLKKKNGEIYSLIWDIFGGDNQEALQTLKPSEEIIAYGLQFTGLLDKNGKEIFEGDIIEIKHSYKDRYYKGEIIYQDAKFIAKDLFFSHLDNPSNFVECLEYIEVIGTIHDKD